MSDVPTIPLGPSQVEADIEVRSVAHSHNLYFDDLTSIALGDDYTSFPDVNGEDRAVARLREVENTDLRRETVRTNEDDLKRELSGHWQLLSSSNIDAFLENRNSSSDIKNLLFKLGDLHIEFNEHQVSTYVSMGRHKFQERSRQLSTPTRFERGFCNTYICENALKTVYQLSENDEGGEEEKMFVTEGRLHVVISRGGVSCERVYERDGKEEEVEMMRLEIMALNRDKKTMEDQLENANAENEKLKLDVETLNDSVKNSEKMMKRKEEENKKLTDQLEKANAEIEKLKLEIAEEFNKKAEEVEELAEADIRKTIVGLWKRIDDTRQWSFKVEGNKFMIRRDGWNQYRVYTFGVKHRNGITVTVEGNRIVQRTVDSRHEWYMENDHLMNDWNVNDEMKFVIPFKRIGAPS